MIRMCNDMGGLVHLHGTGADVTALAISGRLFSPD